jgi:transcriptional regulator with XRE-family HTH domain
MTYGQMIQVARKRKGWTVRTFIERLGGNLSSAYITKIEVHNEIPTPLLTLKMAEVLGIDADILVKIAKTERRRIFDALLERKYEEANIQYRQSVSSCVYPSENLR